MLVVNQNLSISQIINQKISPPIPLFAAYPVNLQTPHIENQIYPISPKIPGWFFSRMPRRAPELSAGFAR